jgi:hypothetical protein
MRTCASTSGSSVKHQNLRWLAALEIRFEALFSELRNHIRLRKVRLRGLRNAKE